MASISTFYFSPRMESNASSFLVSLCTQFSIFNRNNQTEQIGNNVITELRTKFLLHVHVCRVNSVLSIKSIRRVLTGNHFVHHTAVTHAVLCASSIRAENCVRSGAHFV